MGPVTIESAAEAVRGVNYLSRRDDRWLLIALACVFIGLLMFENHDERIEHQKAQEALVVFLQAQNTQESVIIERNTAAFESVQEALKLLSRRPDAER